MDHRCLAAIQLVSGLGGAFYVNLPRKKNVIYVTGAIFFKCELAFFVVVFIFFIMGIGVNRGSRHQRVWESDFLPFLSFSLSFFSFSFFPFCFFFKKKFKI